MDNVRRRIYEIIEVAREDDKASFYLNGEEEPVLTVDKMKHGKNARGSVGFFSEIGTEAFFKDLQIEFEG